MENLFNNGILFYLTDNKITIGRIIKSIFYFLIIGIAHIIMAGPYFVLEFGWWWFFPIWIGVGGGYLYWFIKYQIPLAEEIEKKKLEKKDNQDDE